MTTFHLVLEESRRGEDPIRKVFDINSQEFTDIEQFMNRYSGRPIERGNCIHELAHH